MNYKMYLKVISVILICAIVLQSIPISVAAQTQEIAEQTTEETSAYIIGEDISKREMSVKHFRMSDGSYKAAVYPHPVHYENGQDELLNINNSLYDTTDEADNVLSNRQNSFSVKFMKKSNPNKLYTLDKNGYKIKVAIEGAKKVSLRKTESQERISNLEDFTLTNIGSKVVYEDILENADIEYSVVSSELKENIVLKKEVDFNSIIYTYHLNESFEANQKDNKNITLYDKDGNFVLELSAPVMWDAQGNYSDSLYLELLEVKNSEIKIKLYWDMPKEIVYPVTIDPVMRLSADRTAIQDTHIIARYPNDNYNDNNHLRVRNDGYTMIKFPMPQLNSGDKIINAQLVLAPYGAFDSDSLYSNVDSFSPPLYITTHKILRSWNEKTDTYSSVDPEDNFYDSTAQSYRIVDGDGSYYTWDITILVNEWID